MYAGGSRPNWWRQEMTESQAREELGSAHFDEVVAAGYRHCMWRRSLAWNACNSEAFAAYACAAQVARRSAIDVGSSVIREIAQAQGEALTAGVTLERAA